MTVNLQHVSNIAAKLEKLRTPWSLSIQITKISELVAELVCLVLA
jgi:hypothetical protein